MPSRSYCIGYSVCTNRCTIKLRLRLISVGGDISPARDPITESTNCYNLQLVCRSTVSCQLVLPWLPNLKLRLQPSIELSGFVSSASPTALNAPWFFPAPLDLSFGRSSRVTVAIASVFPGAILIILRHLELTIRQEHQMKII